MGEIVLLSEVVKNLSSANEFCKTNSIKPYAIVILWKEEMD